MNKMKDKFKLVFLIIILYTLSTLGGSYCS